MLKSELIYYNLDVFRLNFYVEVSLFEFIFFKLSVVNSKSFLCFFNINYFLI